MVLTRASLPAVMSNGRRRGDRAAPAARREHARFCSAHCRMTWNREHAGVAAAPAVAIDWSVTALTAALSRLDRAASGEALKLAASFLAQAHAAARAGQRSITAPAG